MESGAFNVKTLYGLKQAAYTFWLKLLEALIMLEAKHILVCTLCGQPKD